MAAPTEDNLRALLKQAQDADDFYTLVAHKYGTEHVARARAFAAIVHGNRWAGVAEAQLSAYEQGREAGRVLGRLLEARTLSLVFTAVAASAAVLFPPRTMFLNGNQFHFGFEFLFAYPQGQSISSAIDSGFLVAELLGLALVGGAWHLLGRLKR